MTTGLILFAVGASMVLLIAYGVVRDVLDNRNVQVRERPPRAEEIDLDAERHKVFPLPKRYPMTPWADEDEAA